MKQVADQAMLHRRAAHYD